ncbi:odorant receptor 13a-like [Frieseomelitta varia]|uniref:odorant receptor 13a-like n=1 Tax=Frieseomelitta varia TaxID=561572 RepID=UPI001CB69656|nr:odorant receptor 13a-like [Frieseomelitta varia]
MRTVTGKLANMNIQRDLNYHIGLNRYILKYTGIWPEERKWNRSSSYHVLVPSLTMLCFVCAPQTINLPLIAHDMNLLVENLSMGNMTITIALVKTIAFWMNGKSLKFLLKCIAEDWATAETKERETMMNIARLTRITTIGCIWLCELVAITYVSLRFISMKYTDNIMVYRGYFPYNITYSPNYELTMIGQTLGAIYGGTTYAAVDTFIAMLVLHACGQLSNLKDSLRNIHSYDKKDLQARLKKIVERHNYIACFVETIENCFNVMLLTQMISCTIQLCFQTFQAIMSFEEEAVEYMIFELTFLTIYVVCVMMQLYLYCYVGERLMCESTDIADTAYHCEWYNLPPEKARLFVIIMSRARTSPLRITAGKFCWFTIILYSQVLKTTVSYISVLYAVKS